MIRKICHVTDSLLTQELARQKLTESEIVVTWFTNRTNRQSVVHSHPYYEIIIPVSGEVLYSYSGEMHLLHRGELIFFPTDIFHSGKYDVGSDVSERLVVQIDAEFWMNTLRRLGKEQSRWYQDVTILSADSVTVWDLRGLFERMSLSCTLPLERRKLVLGGQLTELICLLEQIVAEARIQPPTSTSTLVSKAVDYIQNHYLEPDFSVAALAEYTFVSRGYLSRTFKEYTMESIHGYVTNLRMQHCRQAIAEGKSILESCTSSGFSDYSSFLKTFRKLYGITPVEYRNKLKRQNMEDVSKDTAEQNEQQSED